MRITDHSLGTEFGTGTLLGLLWDRLSKLRYFSALQVPSAGTVSPKAPKSQSPSRPLGLGLDLGLELGRQNEKRVAEAPWFLKNYDSAAQFR